jgi:hypothetical protein
MDFVDYIEIVIWMQIAVICFLFLRQTSTPRRNLSIFYGATLLIHALLFVATPSYEDKYIWFYVLGGALDLSVVIYTCRMKEISRLATDIQDISLVSIMFNILGLSLSYKGVAPDSYMVLFASLYGWAIYTLIRGEPRENGYFEADNRLFAFGRNAHIRDLFRIGKPSKK